MDATNNFHLKLATSEEGASKNSNEIDNIVFSCYLMTTC
jgi:hypothetical protein